MISETQALEKESFAPSIPQSSAISFTAFMAFMPFVAFMANADFSTAFFLIVFAFVAFMANADFSTAFFLIVFFMAFMAFTPFPMAQNLDLRLTLNLRPYSHMSLEKNGNITSKICLRKTFLRSNIFGREQKF